MKVGIDLGTTNSLISIWRDGQANLIPNALGKVLTPSVISIDQGKVLTGEPALNRLVTYPDLTIANFKRYMGSNKIFKLGEFKFRAEELSALILKQLKEDAESYFGEKIEEAIISVPAYFSDAQRKATKIAGKLAGLKVERLINEPTAAGLAYGLQDSEEETHYLIFDLGGGTFDVSIVNKFANIIEVRASNGDNHLGGIDFTKILENFFISKCQDKENFKSKVPLSLQQKIYEEAERTKHKLSLEKNAIMNVSWENEIYNVEVSPSDFQDLSESLMERVRVQIKKALADAKLAASSIDQIILVGGASRMSVIKRLVTKMFGKLPLCHLDPDTAIAEGAAIQAGFKAQNKDLEEFVITDVCPYSLGISVFSRTRNGEGVSHFDPIIERNNTIPVSRVRTYYPISPEQKMVLIEIYQGENFDVNKNIYLGALELEFPNEVLDKSFDIRFTYDINGILEVEAILKATGEKKSIVIQGNPGILSDEEVAEKLALMEEIKIHPRDQAKNKLIINLAERLFEDLIGEKRIMLGNEMNIFSHFLNEQDELKILQSRQRLEAVLTSLQENR